MLTQCSAQSFDFGTVEGRHVEAAFDGGLVTSDAGAFLLGATDRAIRMMGRFALCFHDERRPQYIEHEVAKAEWTHGEANPRFVVTSLGRHECKAKYLYEKLYCARGDMENRIKECLCRPHLDSHHAGQSAAPVVCLHGLRAALCTASYRPA
jgi:hypothetical protein